MINHHTIKEVVVVSRKDHIGEQMLVAYIVPNALTVPKIANLRKALSEKLPEYMIPSRFVMLEALPLTPNGKVDRKALPEPENVRPISDTFFVPPRTPIEQTLTESWSKILGIKPVGIYDKFLELGGNSLQATRIASRVLDIFQVKLSVQKLLTAPTVAAMAIVITQSHAEKMDQEKLDILLKDLEQLSYSEAKKLTKEK